MKTHIYNTGLIFALLLLFSCQIEYKKVENLITFAKAYGYVKYFHPSDEASKINWNRFSIYGASQIENCKTKKDIINTLNRLFKPIAPSIEFTINDEEFDGDLNNTIPDSIESYKLTYWQHQGVSIGMKHDKYKIYESRRINRNSGRGGNQLFDYEPEFGESTVEEIGDGIFCKIPIALFCNTNLTFPRANENELEELKEILKSINHTKPDDLFLRLGNIINVYNVFQHFYPYFDVVDVNWESELRKALTKSYLDGSGIEHLITLEQFTAPLKDGHIFVSNGNIKNFYIPPISWEWIENELVITKYYGDIDPINEGDVVTQINGLKPKDYFDDVYSRISAGTAGWLQYRANIKSLQGKTGTKITLELNNKTTLELERYHNLYRQENKIQKPIYNELEEGIWYINLDRIEMDTVRELLPRLEQSKAIICDLRGYPNYNDEFIRHLLPIDDTTKAWLQIPQIVYPDQEKVVGYKLGNNMDQMKPISPFLGDKIIIFIIDGQVISWAESIMGYIEGYNLATIIGQPSAGTNGTTNIFSLPGGYHITWTGMKVLKHDGSQHHGIGILPDTYVEKTIPGIKDGRDEFLEKALEIARE